MTKKKYNFRKRLKLSTVTQPLVEQCVGGKESWIKIVGYKRDRERERMLSVSD
jgi:hypothetical protein